MGRQNTSSLWARHFRAAQTETLTDCIESFFLTAVPAELYSGENFWPVCALMLCTLNERWTVPTGVLVGPLGEETLVWGGDSDGNSGIPLT